MKIQITINTDNAAFEDNPEEEVQRILKAITRTMLIGYGVCYLIDSNGDTVGRVTITE